MDYSKSKLSEQTCCVLILQLICRDQSLLPRLPANQHKNHKWIQQTIIFLRGCAVCVETRVINKVVSMCLNHAALASRVNIRVNGQDSESRAGVFSVRARILNNNDFLMWNCDYNVLVKYGFSWPHWKLGPKRELLQQHRLQRCARWGNLHKFKSNLNRASNVMEKDFSEERRNQRRQCPELRLLTVSEPSANRFLVWEYT